MKRTIFAANWKMNKTIQETTSFLEALPRLLTKSAAEVWIAPPFTALSAAAHVIREKKLPYLIGAQNVADQPSGAFTGEVSASMLKEAGALFCIIGHSERRTIYRETDAMFQAKVRQALAQGLKPLLCIGESANEREQGRVEEILRLQFASATQDLSAAEAEQLCIAYEPIWAIGTGQAATPELAQEAHAMVRAFLSHQWGADSARKIPLLYGGSVTPENANALLQQPDIDGALIGRASLDPQQFAQLITCVKTS